MMLSYTKSKCGTLTGEVIVNSLGIMAFIYKLRQGDDQCQMFSEKIMSRWFTDAIEADNWMQEKLKNVAWTLLQA